MTDFSADKDNAPEAGDACYETIRQILDETPSVVFVINKAMQTVFTNRAARAYMANPAGSGLRPGDLFKCVHVLEGHAGCGTADVCRECGAFRAIHTALSGNKSVEDYSLLTQNPVIPSLDLQISAAPVTINGEIHALLHIIDISDHKRRAALERIFFHDLVNTAGALDGYLELALGEANPEEKNSYLASARKLAQDIFGEINSQKLLLAAEQGTLPVKPETLFSLQLAEDIIARSSGLPFARGIHLALNKAAEPFTFSADRTIVSRVLSNMVKNAAEAGGGDVTVSCRMKDGEAEFSVHNPSAIAPSARAHIFQRSFSTKGAGRGLGTYSMRLLTENYLGGRVGYTSTESEGTIFFIRLPAETAARNRTIQEIK